MRKPPFFIVGSPRSGTTILRDILRVHPSLESPEETFFFRWAEAFGSPMYNHIYTNNKTIKYHRELDGVSEEEFMKILDGAISRRELQDRYMNLILNKKKKPKARWFDKTPQNIYGIFLLATTYPNGKFIHIHRHPFEVISCIKEGRVIGKHSTIGAINVWLEAMTLANLVKRIWSKRFYELRFQSLVDNPTETISNLLEFLGEDPSLLDIPKDMVKKPPKRFKKILTAEDTSLIRGICASLTEEYNYSENH